MADVFISYAREDIQAARRLAAELEVRGWSVFWDRRIPAGRRFAEVIAQELDGASCVIVLWSQAGNASDWVLDEAAEAAKRNILVPARIEPVAPPMGFRRIHAADLVGWRGESAHEGFERLLEDIAHYVPAPPPEPTGFAAKNTKTEESSPSRTDARPTEPTRPVAPAAWKALRQRRWFIGLVALAVTAGFGWVVIKSLTSRRAEPPAEFQNPSTTAAPRDTGQAAAPANVILSDSFDRADAGPCGLGATDRFLGGNPAYYYLPLFPGPAPNPQIGANIRSRALTNNGQDYGGVQFASTEQTCSAEVRGTDFGQNLNMRVELMVPGLEGRIVAAGPYFRSRAAAPGDGIIGGASAGYWVQLFSTGEVRVRRLNPSAFVAVAAPPANFDNSVFHTFEIAAQGSTLQVALDGRLLTFAQDGPNVTTVAIPAAS